MNRTWIRIFWVAGFCATIISLAQAQNTNSLLMAGAAAVDISPTEFPLNMPGGFNAKMANKVHDPFHSRALVLSDGTTTIAMVVVDTLGAGPEVLNEAKQIASEKTGMQTDRMMICSTHTHSAPASGVTSGPAPAVAYRKVLVAGVAESIIQAHTKLRPASIGFASHPLAEEVFNRRWYLKPGKMPLNPFGEMDQVKMNPSRSPGVLDRPAGPTDPDITVISVKNSRGKPLALFANYALHYVGAAPRGELSADYFGEFARLMPSRLRAGEEFVSMMSNGASGDINNIPFNVGRAPREPFEQIRIVASKAADTAWHAVQKIEAHSKQVAIAMSQREIELRHREISEETLAWAKRVASMKDKKEIDALPRLAQVYARRTISLAEKKETVTVTLQAIRIGDFGIFAIPFETLVEIGLELKEKSPFKQNMVIGLANGRYGYLPTPRQHRLGGYETWLGTNKVQKDASDIIIKNLLEMLGELQN